MSSAHHMGTTSRSMLGDCPFDRTAQFEILAQGAFIRVLSLERKRSVRSNNCSILMLVQLGDLAEPHPHEHLERILAVLSGSTRDIDIKGWYLEGSVIFTELGSADKAAAARTLLIKLRRALAQVPSIPQEIRTSLHILSETSDQDCTEWTGASAATGQGLQESRKKNLHPA